MRRFFVLIGMVLPFALISCGGKASNVANVSPANIEAANTASTSSVPIDFESITDAAAALAEGKRLLDENQTDTAIRAFERAIAIDPDLAEAHFNLGIAYDLLELQMKQTGVPIETTTSTSTNSNTKKKEEVKKTRSELAFEAAVKAYEKWLRKNPKDDNAQYYLGRTYAKLMKDEEARDAFEEAVKLKPDDAEYQIEYGAILIKLAQYHEAIKPLKKAIELDGSNGRAIDLLDDAEAGRRRVDYVSSNKNANTAAPSKSTSSNSSSNTASNSSTPSNSAPQQPESTPKPKKPDNEPKTKKGDPDARPRISP